ncbi:MAG TPA: sarcosine oxidase subunit alpha family protein [Steroidobacteraceae bacterium]|nr:sarcosine oxidase subunit alpha family protein [Steroidobacteraceae bacterium]
MTDGGGRSRTTVGGRVDRTRVLNFTFDGRHYTGFHGDTLASALLANGVHLVGRSFKYHRPRGIFSAGAEEPNALVGVRRDAARYVPNLRATQIELYESLQAESQNRWPSLEFDVGAVNDAVSPFIPAGFYYKTFMWPRSAWHSFYEPRIRATAGLGHAPEHADPDRYANRFAHCDVLVVGAGPAGLAATLAAARTGARVILCDEQSELGGSLLSEAPEGGATIDGFRSRDWLREAVTQLTSYPAVTVLPRTTAFGYFPHNLVGLNQRLTDHLGSLPSNMPRERTWQVRAKEVVLATGAIERPLVFPGNDRPGIMLASAARTYVNRYGVLPGNNAVVVAAHDEAYRAAIDLRNAGVDIARIVDVRENASGDLPDAARTAGIQIQLQSTIVGTSGRLRVNAVQIAAVDGHGEVSSGSERIACDLVVMSGGLTPSVHLFSQSRGKLEWEEELQAFVPGDPAEKTRSAGACAGVFDLKSVLGHQYPVVASNARRKGFAGSLPQRPDSGQKAFVDWQHDVTTRDLKLATQEGFRSIEHIKRYTTTGMATDQGKTSNLNALAVVSREIDKPVPKVGLTTFRMPYTPITFGSFAGFQRGDLFDPVRMTPTHSWASARGAIFEDVSLWKRARYFPRAGEDMHAAVARECLAVRNSCGIFDASTLGKIEVVGKDAATFMNRMYVNSWSNLAVGRSRYGVLLRDDGFVYDDGVVARTAENRFHVTTTTGGAARVLALMEDYIQTEWTDLDVWLTSTTEQWAVVAVQGPNARKVLEPLIEGVDMSARALPHMSVVHGKICGVPMLLFRVSFTGELGFEVNVPADYGLAVWEAIHQAGLQHGMTEYGTETMHVLRAEKGYIIVGQDTDGTVTPDDAGLSWAIGKNKEDFLGKRSLMRPTMSSPDRKQLVGLATVDPQVVLEEGAQVAPQAALKPPFRPIGHVTSSYRSAALGRSIALAMVNGGRARTGQTLYVSMPGGDIPVQVTSPVFYDSQGSRLNG